MAVEDPLRLSLVPGAAAAPAAVARALAQSLLPVEHAGPAPDWLMPGQLRSFRRAIAALERHRGALLADPVGSGKTYVALAIAATLQRGRTTACLVPAALTAQWRDVAARLGVPLEVGSHQQASRNKLPGSTHGLVIVDESHHYRNPHTRRYEHAARWLLGRPVLLLSATPVVNTMEDLAHQLLLGVRDDALRTDGVVSLLATLASGVSVAALGGLVIEDSATAGPRPLRTSTVSLADPQENTLAIRMLECLGTLRLSTHPPTAAVVRSVLQRALTSSPAALVGALRRYRGLLLHARDAREAGRELTRAELRAFSGQLDDQLVLWELLEDGTGRIELALEDLDAVAGVLADAALAAQAVDPKMERLRRILSDETPTLVFVTRRETVRHLRERLGGPPIAWCTGERAGLGHAPCSRAMVLGWFRETSAAPAPRCLVVTDVAAEGLDLRRAARVVHYDLPWTATRLEQREGRAVRLGSGHDQVEVVRFLPPPALDAALRLGEHLARKAALPGRTGLGAEGLRLWRWRAALADRLGRGLATVGTAVVRMCSEENAWLHTPGCLAGFELLEARSGGAMRLAAVVGWLDAVGRWTEDEGEITGRLEAAARAQDGGCPSPARLDTALTMLMGPIRSRLALVGARRWTAAEPQPAARRLATRLGERVREAARRRDAGALTCLEAALAFAAGGHTAGEARLVRRLAECEPPELARALTRLPAPTRGWGTIEVRLTGLILFER